MLEDGLVDSSEENEISGKSSEPGAAGSWPSPLLLFLLEDTEEAGETSLTPFMLASLSGSEVPLTEGEADEAGEGEEDCHGVP